MPPACETALGVVAAEATTEVAEVLWGVAMSGAVLATSTLLLEPEAEPETAEE